MDPLTLAIGVGVTTIAGLGAGLRLRNRVQRAEAAADRLRHELETERHAAHHDPLTGLPNRRAFYRLGSRLVTDAGRPPIACIVVDLNTFKQVNDDLGHAAGDEVLVTVAQRLAQFSDGNSPVNLVARLGGDEFAGLFTAPAADWTAPCPAAADLADLLAAPMSVAGHNLRITAAVGAAPVNRDTGRTAGNGAPEREWGAASLTTALRHADSAMYRAKVTGARAAHFNPLLDSAPAVCLPRVLATTRPQHRQPPTSWSPRPAAGALVNAARPGSWS